MAIADALHEKLVMPGWDAAVRSAIEAAERGWLADRLVRTGIRSFVRERLEQQERGGVRAAELATRLRAMPIAIETDLANEQHYEVPAAFFEKMLGPRLKYSSSWWPAGVTDLAAAEEAMLELTRERAGIEDGMRVLDLGCGWGSFGLWLAEKQRSTQVTCVSNSSSQKEFIERKARERGLDNIRVHTSDINRLELLARFDRVVSVEMFEHARNYQMLLGRIRRWLVPGGRLFVHVFCHRRHAYLYEGEGAGDWMTREFFSGGTMPSFDLFGQFQEDLAIENQWWIDGTHYSRTLEAWLANVDANTAELARILSSVGAGPAVAGERSVQRWRLFLLACSEMFGYDEGKEWGIGHYVFSESGA